MTVIVGKAETVDLSGGDFCGIMVQVSCKEYKRWIRNLGCHMNKNKNIYTV